MVKNALIVGLLIVVGCAMLYVGGQGGWAAVYTTFTVSSPTGGGGPGPSACTGAGGACPGSILPPCPGGCTWTAAYNEDFQVASTVNITHTPSGDYPQTSGGGVTDTSAELYTPLDGTSPGSSPGGINACAQMIDTSTLPGYLTVKPIGTVGWEAPNALVCGAIYPIGGAAGQMPGNGSCGYACQQVPGPVYYEYEMIAGSDMIDEVVMWNINGVPWADPKMFTGYFMEARAGGFGAPGGNLPMLWQNDQHSRIQGPNLGWTVGGPAHVVGFLMDPAAGYSYFWDGTQTFPGSGCTLGPCTGDPDNCATKGVYGCYANTPSASWWSFDLGLSSYCDGSNYSSCNNTQPNTKIYWIRAYRGY
jgi:hypothetical protein